MLAREGVDKVDEKMKALANGILEQCQEQELTFQQVRTLLMLLEQRVDEAKECAMEEAGKHKFKAIPF